MRTGQRMVPESQQRSRMMKRSNIRVTPLPYNLRDNKGANMVHDALVKGQRVFGTPGGFMSHQVHDHKYTSAEGADTSAASEMMDAEKETYEVIEEWLKDKPNGVHFSSVRPMDEPVPALDPETGLIMGHDFDHIILFGNEMIIIDTFRWPKNKTYTVDSDHKSILMTKRHFPGNQPMTGEYIGRMTNREGGLLPDDEDLNFVGLVLVNNDKAKSVWDKNWYESYNFRLVEIDRFTELLDKKYATLGPGDLDVINSNIVYHIVQRCVQPYNEFRRVIGEKHLREFM